MIEQHYYGAETISKPVPLRVVGSNVEKDFDPLLPANERIFDAAGRIVSIPFPKSAINPNAPHKSDSKPHPSILKNDGDRVVVRVRDLTRNLHAMAADQLAWLEDLGDDPVVLTRDFYEVFLACQNIRRAS